MKKQKFDRKELFKIFEAFEFASGFGFIIAIPIVLGGLLGAFLDARLNSSPIFLISLLLLGVAAGIYGAIKNLKEKTIL